MLFTLAVILVVAWLLGFTVLHATGGLIHLLLLLAVVAIVLHFSRRRSVG